MIYTERTGTVLQAVVHHPVPLANQITPGKYSRYTHVHPMLSGTRCSTRQGLTFARSRILRRGPHGELHVRRQPKPKQRADKATKITTRYGACVSSPKRHSYFGGIYNKVPGNQDQIRLVKILEYLVPGI